MPCPDIVLPTHRIITLHSEIKLRTIINITSQKIGQDLKLKCDISPLFTLFVYIFNINWSLNQ